MLGINATEKIREGSIYGQIATWGHEQLVFCYDEPTGLKAIIGIHNTVLGPALGGSRLWNYTSEEAAIKDVLRLSRGMTFKASISGLNLGGGKAVLDKSSSKNIPSQQVAMQMAMDRIYAMGKVKLSY